MSQSETRSWKTCHLTTGYYQIVKINETYLSKDNNKLVWLSKDKITPNTSLWEVSFSNGYHQLYLAGDYKQTLTYSNNTLSVSVDDDDNAKFQQFEIQSFENNEVRNKTEPRAVKIYVQADTKNPLFPKPVILRYYGNKLPKNPNSNTPGGKFVDLEFIGEVMSWFGKKFSW